MLQGLRWHNLDTYKKEQSCENNYVQTVNNSTRSSSQTRANHNLKFGHVIYSDTHYFRQQFLTVAVKAKSNNNES